MRRYPTVSTARSEVGDMLRAAACSALRPLLHGVHTIRLETPSGTGATSTIG